MRKVCKLRSLCRTQPLRNPLQRHHTAKRETKHKKAKDKTENMVQSESATRVHALEITLTAVTLYISPYPEDKTSQTHQRTDGRYSNDHCRPRLTVRPKFHKVQPVWDRTYPRVKTLFPIGKLNACARNLRDIELRAFTIIVVIT